MMKYAALILLILFAGCTKSNWLLYRNYLKDQKHGCYPVSINANTHNSSDFYVIKTFNNIGLLTHLKLQLRDLDGDTHVYDYNVSYAPGKAVFKGTTKIFYWLLDNPPPDGEYPLPGAPRHPEEQVNLRETRDFEILFETKTGYAREVRYVNSSTAELRLTYDKNGRLMKVSDYNVTTDKKGNILSILLPKERDPYGNQQQLGVTYTYSDVVDKNRRQYYETPAIFIHPMFSLLEVLDWGPFQPTRERTGFSILHTYYDPLLGEYPLPIPFFVAQYTGHRYDANGNLTGYTFDGDLTKDYTFPVNHETAQIERVIAWSCSDNVKGR